MKIHARQWMESLLREHPVLRYSGLAAICLGVLLMAVGYLLGWTNHNWVLFLALGLVIVGVIMHIPNSHDLSADGYEVQDADNGEEQ